MRATESAETGMRRRDDVKMRRQFLVVRHPARIAATAVQHQQRLAPAAAQYLNVDARNGCRVFSPVACHVVLRPQIQVTGRRGPGVAYGFQPAVL